MGELGETLDEDEYKDELTGLLDRVKSHAQTKAS